MSDEAARPPVPEQEVLPLSGPNNYFCWLAGGLILAANKVRHSVRGYLTPRTFPVTDFQRAIEYDMEVIESWRRYLAAYTGSQASFAGRNVLELGPGADLGIAVLLLAGGANKYCALDVNNLVESVPEDLYTTLFSTIEKEKLSSVDLDMVRAELARARSLESDKLKYRHDPSFDARQFGDDEIDLVVSQAAFEHFDDFPNTIAQLADVVKPGCILIAEIDLATHTRWIRDIDPLNIYRYSDTYYKATSFRGSPNRMRPHEYARHAESAGWQNVRIVPRMVAANDYVEGVRRHLHPRFQQPEGEAGMLSVMLCATR